MERAAYIKGGRILGSSLTARIGQWCGRWRLLLGQGGQQGFDFTVALGDLLEQELIGGEVLPKREQVLGAIVAGQGRHDLAARGVAAMVAKGGQPLRVALSIQDAAHDLESG